MHGKLRMVYGVGVGVARSWERRSRERTAEREPSAPTRRREVQVLPSEKVDVIVGVAESGSLRTKEVSVLSYYTPL